MARPYPPTNKSFLRKGHGKDKGKPHIEVVPDEISFPVPAPTQAEPSAALTFAADGKIADSLTARELGRRGGLAKAKRTRLTDSLGLADLAADAAFAPYRAEAERWVGHRMAELAQLAGGHVSSGPASMVTTAALQLAASRYCFDQAAHKGVTELMKLGSQLGDASRQNNLAAYELAVREATIRKAEEGPRDPLLG